MNDFGYMLFVVIVLVIAQGALWAWVGLQAQKIPGWPIKTELDLLTSQTVNVSDKS
jgi:hypothetical protein